MTVVTADRVQDWDSRATTCTPSVPCMTRPHHLGTLKQEVGQLSHLLGWDHTASASITIGKVRGDGQPCLFTPAKLGNALIPAADDLQHHHTAGSHSEASSLSIHTLLVYLLCMDEHHLHQMPAMASVAVMTTFCHG